MAAVAGRSRYKLFEKSVLKEIALKFGTPCYVYDSLLIQDSFRAFKETFENNVSEKKINGYEICYACKANSNLSILQLLDSLGSSFDIVSIGECNRLIKLGINPGKIIYSGVGKTKEEIKQALIYGIHCFNIENINEIDIINDIAFNLGKIANIGFRINPNVNAETHPYISTGLHKNKFGITMNSIKKLFENIIKTEQNNNNNNNKYKNIKIIGIGFHIGSQLLKVSPIIESIDCMIDLLKWVKDNTTNNNNTCINIRHLDIGGGIGIDYKAITENEIILNILRIKTFINNICNHINNLCINSNEISNLLSNIKIVCEPGRSIIAQSGILLSKILYKKQSESNKNFIIIDASMTELIRPALYQSYHPIIAISNNNNNNNNNNNDNNISCKQVSIVADIVGPVCESADFLGQNIEIDGNIKENDFIAIYHCGAYGSMMSSHYNSRPKIEELMLIPSKMSHDNDLQIEIKTIRKKETMLQMYQNEWHCIDSLIKSKL